MKFVTYNERVFRGTQKVTWELHVAPELPDKNFKKSQT